MDILLNPQLKSEKNCLLILCPGCKNLMAKCKFIYHCENECPKVELKCINYTLGCMEILTKLTMNYHLNYICNYKIKNLCSCSDISIKESINNEVFSSQCLEHCVKCILRNCEETDCQVIDCVNECGMRMHICKLREHITAICRNSIVQCINKCYGCSVSMLRSERGVHLKWCVTSVVPCGVEWSRDVSGCKIYQRYMDEGGGIWIQRHKRELINLGDKTIDRGFSDGMSLRDEINLCVSLNESDLYPQTADLYCSTATINNEMEECFSVLGRPTTDIGNSRKSSLSHFMNGSIISNSDGVRGTYSGEVANCEVGMDISDGDLCGHRTETVVTNKAEDSWRVRHMSKGQISRCPGTFTFQCGQAVPRADYSDHYRQHCDLACQMDGWVEMSCPFASLGCTFTAMRLSPSRSVLVYHPRSDYYGVRYQDHCTHLSFKSDSSLSLLQMPIEILIRVCAFLDGCSLQHASNTHPRLLQAIEMLRGGYYVCLKWSRTEHQTWRSHPKSFLPCTRGSSAAVRRLMFTDQSVGVITAHMSQCLFRGPLSLSPDTPSFCLHSLAPGLPDSILPKFLRNTSHAN